MKDFSDMTFIIPIRVDSIDRLENLLLTTNFLLKHFQARIIVWEATDYNNQVLSKLLNKKIDYFFYEDFDQIFYRTKYINQVTSLVNTPFIAVWDADVIAPHEQIEIAYDLLQADQSDFVYPYKDKMLNVPYCIKKVYSKDEDISILKSYSSGMGLMYPPKAIGGAFMVNRAKYIEAGMENENYYGWGPEDLERYERWNKLNYRVHQITGDLFHFDHSRGINSQYHAEIQLSLKYREINRIKTISASNLKKEIEQWSSIKNNKVAN